MRRDSIKLSLAAATILATGILTTNPVSAISFKFTGKPPYKFFSASGIPLLVDNFAGSPTVSGTFSGDIDGNSVTLGGKRLGDVGTGYGFGGSFIQPFSGGFLFRVTGDSGSEWAGRESVYVLTFTCYLDSQNSCNGSKGTYFRRNISTSGVFADITISDFSWENLITPTPAPTQPSISNPSPTPTQPPIDTPSKPSSTSIPEPSTATALLLLAGGWLWRRKFVTKSSKGKLAV
jgi:hypothetical protein